MHHNIVLLHFGEDCAPGIIIDDILKQNIKCLFMLGLYKFNDILFYLQDNNLEKIYEKESLRITSNDHVTHNFYNFIFNNDYQIKEEKFVNYDIVKKRFDVKIKNFREAISSDCICIFITFTEILDSLNIIDMLSWLKKNKPNFHLIVYTYNPYVFSYESCDLSILKLEMNYKDWWCMEKPTEKILYKEIYEKFVNTLKSKGFIHNFPQTLEETNYGK